MNGWAFLAAALAGGMGAGCGTSSTFWSSGAGRAGFPSASLVVNVTGSFALGVLTGLGRRTRRHDLAGVLGVGPPRRVHDLQHGIGRVGAADACGRARRGWMNPLVTLGLGVAAGAAGLWVGGLF